MFAKKRGFSVTPQGNFLSSQKKERLRGGAATQNTKTFKIPSQGLGKKAPMERAMPSASALM